jgi:hypothetical protein
MLGEHMVSHHLSFDEKTNNVIKWHEINHKNPTPQSNIISLVYVDHTCCFLKEHYIPFTHYLHSTPITCASGCLLVLYFRWKDLCHWQRKFKQSQKSPHKAPTLSDMPSIRIPAKSYKKKGYLLHFFVLPNTVQAQTYIEIFIILHQYRTHETFCISRKVVTCISHTETNHKLLYI